MRCAIVQPSYIPWRGYFDLISRVDRFVFYDDVQYDHRGWRNRNRIKTPRGTQWLTVPVHARRIPICEIETVDSDWPREHLAALTRSYLRAPHFDEFRPWLERVYASPPRQLADFTIALTLDVARFLGITTPTLRSSSLQVHGAKTERLLEVLRAVGATRYLSGPSARAYLDVELLASAGIEVEWMTYDVPEYEQLYPPFDPHVTVLDFLFMAGAGGLKPALRSACST
ncbi:MAG TPA: WbqC family protein [Thermoanaerobaculia bacterium]|nr:WbqC family protein [Thermoanaerobaculia bacterium]